MNKVGYIAKIKSKGREYFYLRKSVRKSSSIEKKQIYSFGSKEATLEKLLTWEKNIELMPEELKRFNYGVDDILYWINQVESK